MRTHPALILLLSPLAACFWSPQHRSVKSSEGPIGMYGFALQPGDTVSFQARDNDSNTFVNQPGLTTTANTSPFYISPNFFFWSKTLPVLPANFWAPQDPDLNGLATSLGRLELKGHTTDGQMLTYTAEAQECVWDEIDAGSTPENAGIACHDGDTLVLFDNDGVGNGPPTTGWVTDYTTDVGSVKWELGHYKVQGHDIYGLLCYPDQSINPPAQYRTVILNHGGYGPINDCVLQDWCIDKANQGWVVAMSIYRGQTVNVTVPGIGLVTRTSGGNIELCLGEVTDVLRLTDLVRQRADTNDAKMLMWGHSHGGCITTRAIEQGADVKAAVAVAGPTNFSTWASWGAPLGCMLGPGVSTPANNTSYCPPSGVPGCLPGAWADPVADIEAYRWRSATHFAPDLQARTDVPFLMIHGSVDAIVPPSQPCELVNTVAGTGSQNWFVAPPGTTLPTGCGAVAWQPAATLPTTNWPADRYFLLYNNYNHDIVINKTASPWAAFNSFIAYHFGP